MSYNLGVIVHLKEVIMSSSSRILSILGTNKPAKFKFTLEKTLSIMITKASNSVFKSNYTQSLRPDPLYEGVSGTHGDFQRHAYHKSIADMAKIIKESPFFNYKDSTRADQAMMLSQAREEVRLATWDTMEKKDVDNLKARQVHLYNRPEGPSFIDTLKIAIIKESPDPRYEKDGKNLQKCYQLNEDQQGIFEGIKDSPEYDSHFQKIIKSCEKTSVNYNNKFGLIEKIFHVDPGSNVSISNVDPDSNDSISNSNRYK